MPRLEFPSNSLLAAMHGEGSSVEARRAARRVRAERAPAVAISDGIVRLARELALSEVSRSLAVLDALPPLFWLEAGRGDGSGAPGADGWVVERKGGGLVVRRFTVTFGDGASPRMAGTATIRFGTDAGEDDEDARAVRGLIAAVGLPEVLSQMGESAPVVLLPADAPDPDMGVLRGLRLSVATSPDSVPS